jgi:ketosteroid isomerase-like protein
MLRTGHTLSILRRCEDGKWRLARDANLVVPA